MAAKKTTDGAADGSAEAGADSAADGAQEAGEVAVEQSEDQVPAAPSGTAAAPLAPDEATAARSPHLGRPDSSTNPVSANAAVMSPTGSSHVGLVGEDGQPIPLEEVFEFPGVDNPRHVATVRQRVFQKFRYPNTTEPAMHLLYPAGAEVPVAEALRVMETFKHAAAEELPAG